MAVTHRYHKTLVCDQKDGHTLEFYFTNQRAVSCVVAVATSGTYFKHKSRPKIGWGVSAHCPHFIRL